MAFHQVPSVTCQDWRHTNILILCLTFNMLMCDVWTNYAMFLLWTWWTYNFHAPACWIVECDGNRWGLTLCLQQRNVSTCCTHAPANKCLEMLMQWHWHVPTSIKQPTVVVTMQWCCPFRFQHVVSSCALLTAQKKLSEMKGKKERSFFWRGMHTRNSTCAHAQTSFCVWRGLLGWLRFICFCPEFATAAAGIARVWKMSWK